MKSAYELAMERLDKESGPSRKLSDEQKARIAEIENKYEAKIAETKLSYEDRFPGAESVEDLENLRQELAGKIVSLEADRDQEKDNVWNAAE